jgi:hypothetical protein
MKLNFNVDWRFTLLLEFNGFNDDNDDNVPTRLGAYGYD